MLSVNRFYGPTNGEPKWFLRPFLSGHIPTEISRYCPLALIRGATVSDSEIINRIRGALIT